MTHPVGDRPEDLRVWVSDTNAGDWRALDDWHLVELRFDLPAHTIGVTIDGVFRASLLPLGEANAVTHLLALLEESSEPSEIAFDELIVQDISRGLPAVAFVGPTTPA